MSCLYSWMVRRRAGAALLQRRQLRAANLPTTESVGRYLASLGDDGIVKRRDAFFEGFPED